MTWWRIAIAVAFLSALSPQAFPQRTYAPHSVLSTGPWFKIGITAPGIYKLDLAFLKANGITTGNIPTGALKLFGNGGLMLPETCTGVKTDDLQEVALFAADGNDGLIDGNDYLLFYAPGPHQWRFNAGTSGFHHLTNLYSDTAYYFITTGNAGLRITNAPLIPGPATSITDFDDHYFHELDTINFLNSGKQWIGEEFASGPGKTTTRTFPVPFSTVVAAPVKLVTSVVARSFNTGSRFVFAVNNSSILEQEVPPVATGIYDLFVRTDSGTTTFIPATNSIYSLSVQFSPGSTGSQGWLNWFEIHAKRPLNMQGIGYLAFRNIQGISAGLSGLYEISNPSNGMQVWEVSDFNKPVVQAGTLTGNVFRFTADRAVLKEYVAFSADSVRSPVAMGRVANQNLHNSGPADMLIIVHPDLYSQALRLAAFHQQEGLQSVVVTTTQIYNEFSSGSPDPAALRDFVKMYYDKAGTDTANRPEYLLLFGDASFDYKARLARNTNLVPAWQSDESYDPLSTYTSDDFFGFLDDEDGINNTRVPLLDIGIGRIPAATLAEAKAFVDKVIAYSDRQAFGPWRNELTFVADDEDANLHFQDAEVISRQVKNSAPVFNTEKIYLDAFEQQSSASGSRYPTVNAAILNKLYQGTLIWNYNGHGGYRRLAEEVVLDEEIIRQINNPFRLPLFITATCDFAPFDNPLVRSIGDELLFKAQGGSIALMTTTRIVFAFSNRVMNANYLQTAMQKKSDSTYPSLGEAVKNAKNITYRSSGDVVNNRKFTLLGDPAVTLAFPKYRIRTDILNGRPVHASGDTLRALNEYTVEGAVTDLAGKVLEQFNGTVFPIVYDKEQREKTKGNDPGSIPEEFPVQKNALFKGKASVMGGRFKFSFIVPRDIDYRFGKGRVSYYAENGVVDANAAFDGFVIGGSGNQSSDQEGPAIRAFLNDENFVNGGITNARPLLLLKLTDSSGINTMGTAIGHDLVAILNNDPSTRFVLNRHYESELDNFRKGQVRYQLPVLPEGLHTLSIRAWDVANNSSEAILDFRIAKEQAFVLEHVLNYPNPFTTRTSFWFDHNRSGEELSVHIQIYTVTGRLVKSLRNTIFSIGNRSSEVEWDGRDDYGNRLARGVYIYRIRVRTSDGKSADKLEKLYLL